MIDINQRRKNYTQKRDNCQYISVNIKSLQGLRGRQGSQGFFYLF